MTGEEQPLTQGDKTQTKATVNSAIRFPPELHAALTKAAADRMLSVNFLVVKAVEDFLPRLIPVEELRLTR